MSKILAFLANHLFDWKKTPQYHSSQSKRVAAASRMFPHFPALPTILGCCYHTWVLVLALANKHFSYFVVFRKNNVNVTKFDPKLTHFTCPIGLVSVLPSQCRVPKGFRVIVESEGTYGKAKTHAPIHVKHHWQSKAMEKNDLEKVKIWVFDYSRWYFIYEMVLFMANPGTTNVWVPVWAKKYWQSTRRGWLAASRTSEVKIIDFGPLQSRYIKIVFF